jgi:hypothetical protein
MQKKSCTSNAPTPAALLADAIVLGCLTGASLLGARAESDLSQARNEKRGLAAKSYRPDVGIRLLNASNQVFVGRRRNTKGKAWQRPQGCNLPTPRGYLRRQIAIHIKTEPRLFEAVRVKRM